MVVVIATGLSPKNKVKGPEKNLYIFYSVRRTCWRTCTGSKPDEKILKEKGNPCSQVGVRS
jgi:hypothetical protein